LTTHRVYEALPEVEQLIANAEGGEFKVELPLEYNARLGKNLSNGFKVSWAWKRVDKAQLQNITTQVRSRLLDFVLRLQYQIGEDVSDMEIKKKTEDIDAKAIFGRSVFGDNTTFVIGDGNTLHVRNKVAKDDFTGLADALRGYDVAEEDIEELKTAVEADRSTEGHAQKKLGPSVGAWFKGMIAKAGTTAWQLDLGVASNALYDALKHYYGWW